MSDISNSDQTVDSRDVIARIEELNEELAEWIGDDQDKTLPLWVMAGNFDAEELTQLLALQEQAESSPNWQHGETLIRHDYFEQYMDQTIADCYTLPKDLPDWIKISYDYDALRQDYFSVDFDGVEYLIRN